MKGPITDYITLNFITKIGNTFADNYQGKYRVSASEGSKFRRLIELILRETGIDIGTDIVEKRIKYVKKHILCDLRGGNS
jgi:hypothetical protein